MARRFLIIGNSGSGKSWLASRLAEKLGLAHVDLDRLHWQDETYGFPRPEAEARALTLEAAAADAWIIEGVYGWLAEIALARADHLLWLDLPWIECRANLLRRGKRPLTDDESFAELLIWAEGYWDRRTSSSSRGHAKLFEGFKGEKRRLTHGRDMDGWLAGASSP